MKIFVWWILLPMKSLSTGTEIYLFCADNQMLIFKIQEVHTFYPVGGDGDGIGGLVPFIFWTFFVLNTLKYWIEIKINWKFF